MPFTTNHSPQIHFVRQGQGPLLTILGGLGDNARNWSALLPMLSRHFDVVVVENRGAGQSDRPVGPYSISEMADDILAVWQELGIQNSNVLGFSMGGKIAMQLALKSPHQIDKLILVATAACSQESSSPFSDDVKKMLEDFEPTNAHAQKQFFYLFSDRYQKRFSAEKFANFKMQDLYPQTRQNFLDQLSAVQNFDVRNDIKKISHQTLLIHGDQDKMSDLENSKWLQSQMPNATLKVYQDVGHIPQAEETKMFLEDLREFLNS